VAQRGEFVLLELEEKALKAIGRAWDEYDKIAADGEPQGVPVKLLEQLAGVHKMVMQRMNAKYGLDKSAPDLEQVLAGLAKEAELVREMIAQRQREGALQ
jgi:hypothetical protein